MTRFASLFVLVLLLISGTALARIDAVYYTEYAMEGDDLDVFVEGSLVDACWDFLGSSTNAYNQTLVVAINTLDSAPEDTCPQIITPYVVSAIFPSLTQGVFTLRIYEYRTPWPAIIEDYTIEVNSPVAIDETTWEAIKFLYR